MCVCVNTDLHFMTKHLTLPMSLYLSKKNSAPSQFSEFDVISHLQWHCYATRNLCDNSEGNLYRAPTAGAP